MVPIGGSYLPVACCGHQLACAQGAHRLLDNVFKSLTTISLMTLAATVLMGIVGALIGGYISTNFLGGPPVTGINFTSLLIAIAGSIILLVIYNAVARRT